MNKRATVALVLGLLCVDTVNAQQSTMEQLQAADNIRTSNRPQFSDLLSQLQPARPEMSNAEQDYLDFLLAFRDTLEGRHEEAITTLQRLVVSHGALELRFRAGITLAQTQVLRRQYIEAFTILAQSLTWLEQVNTTSYRVEGLLAAANIYSEAGLYDQSLSYLDLLEQMTLTPRSQCIAQILRQQNQRLSGMQLNAQVAQNVLSLCQSANQPLFAGFASLQVLYSTLQAKDPHKALSQADSFRALIEQAAYPRLNVEFYQLKATAEIETGQLDAAKQTLGLLQENTKNAPQSNPAVAGLKLAADLYAGQGDYKTAFEIQQQYSQAEQTLRDDKSFKLLAYQLAKVEMLKKDQQLSLMQEQIRTSELQQQLGQEQAWRNRILLIATASLLLVLAAWFWRLLRRHRFYKLAAENDSLTAISNRFHFEQLFSKALKRCKQQNEAIGLIVFDLDHFKQINDTFGHEAGDKSLQAVVNICNHFIRSGDIFGRIGGEEFALVLPECQPDKVLMMAEICRDAIEQLDCSDIAADLKITASFGVSHHLNAGYQMADMLRQADQALYLAKYQGRNRVESYERMNPNQSHVSHPNQPLN